MIVSKLHVCYQIQIIFARGFKCHMYLKVNFLTIERILQKDSDKASARDKNNVAHNKLMKRLK